MMRQKLELFVAAATALNFFVPALLACSCASYQPICATYAGTTETVFVGKAVSVEPHDAWGFGRRLTAVLEAAGLGKTPINELSGAAYRLYISEYRSHWRQVMSPEAHRALGRVTSRDEFSSWRAEFSGFRERRIVQFQVSEVFAGDVGDTFRLRVGLGNCSPGFEVGTTEYLIFANEQEGQWSTSICSGTLPVEEAEDQLEYLRRYPAASPTARVIGQVDRFEYSPSTGRSNRLPAPGASVTVRNSEREWDTNTDANGNFELKDLPPGDYSISASYLGWIVTEWQNSGDEEAANIPITRTIRAKGCGSAVLTAFQAPGSVRGRVFGPEGVPVVGLSVDVLPANRDFPQHRATTDEDGTFKVGRLEPGSYVAGVNIARPPSADGQAYHTIYYPGVPSKASALRFHIHRGETAEIGNLHMGQRLAVRTIRGKLVRSDGGPIKGAWVSLKHPGFLHSTDSTTVSEDGAFELHGVTGFPYSVGAHHSEPRFNRFFEGSIEIDDSGDVSVDVELVRGQ